MEHLAHWARCPLSWRTKSGIALVPSRDLPNCPSEKADQRIAPLLAPVLTEIGRLEKLVKDLLLYSSVPARGRATGLG
jgi:hypothetical protein